MNLTVRLLLFFIFATHLFASDASHLSVKGVVRDNSSKAPISGAIVSVTGNLGRYDAVSDGDGAFTVPLVDSVKEGQVIRLVFYKPGFESFEKELLVSKSSSLKVTLIIEHKKPLPSIEEVNFLTSASKEQQNLELIISNPTEEPLWTKRLNFLADFAESCLGVTRFLTEVEYQISIDSLANGKIEGSAGVPNDTTKYSVTGWLNAYIDTQHRHEQGWKMSLASPLLLRIDPHDKLRLRLSLNAGKKELLKSSGEGGSRTCGGVVRRTFQIVLLTDKGRPIKKDIDDLRLLEWVSSFKSPSPKNSGN